MNVPRGTRRRGASGRVAVAVCLLSASILAVQREAPVQSSTGNVKGFREFTERVHAYLALRKRVVSGLPDLTSTDLQEMIAAYQQALARKLREARPKAKVGDLFTSEAREAFRRVSRAALGGPERAGSRAYMRVPGPSPAMPLSVNGVYPDSEPITIMSPVLLAVYPALSEEVAYRVVGRTLILIDLQSRLILDFSRFTLPPEPLK